MQNLFWGESLEDTSHLPIGEEGTVGPDAVTILCDRIHLAIPLGTVVERRSLRAANPGPNWVDLLRYERLVRAARQGRLSTMPLLANASPLRHLRLPTRPMMRIT